MLKANPLRVVLLRIYALLIFVLALIFFAGGYQLLTLGGSAYYLLAGLALLITTVGLWLRRRWASWLYGAPLLATLLWSLWEVGIEFWALLPRLLPLAVLGLFLLTPWAQKAFREPPVRPVPGAAGWATLALVLATVTLLLLDARIAPGPLSPPS